MLPNKIFILIQRHGRKLPAPLLDLLRTEDISNLLRRLSGSTHILPDLSHEMANGIHYGDFGGDARDGGLRLGCRKHPVASSDYQFQVSVATSPPFVQAKL